MQELSKTAVVVLNCHTINETREFLDSLNAQYPDMRTIVVDNGSPVDLYQELEQIVRHYPRTTLHQTGSNLGFARGNNVGIRIARHERYEYIICSNNDIEMPCGHTIEPLLQTAVTHHAALVGPRVVNLNDREQNPLHRRRPNKREAYFSFYHNYSPTRQILKRLVSPRLLKHIGRRFIHDSVPVREPSDASPIQPQPIYALGGAFLMFCPPFFRSDPGFDEGTFIYCEELILAEMLIRAGLMAWFDPRARVTHKESRTMHHLWGGPLEKEPLAMLKRSLKYWYHQHYRVTNREKMAD
jgi:GT2 family glycosyltransferase